MRALLSVYRKEGVVDLARELSTLGYELVASGGTSSALTEAGIAHLSVEEATGSPEMLDGRVKTLHPRIHGGILADRSKPTHMADLERMGIETIDVVVCNLYPFAETPSIETIDVGGPSMIRAAAKNHASVAVVVDPSDYQPLLEALRQGEVSLAFRRRLAAKAFDHLSAYDRLISDWLAGDDEKLPERIGLRLEKARGLRYGENPHQNGALYFSPARESWLRGLEQHSGMELSYLNLFDADAAWRLVHELAGTSRPAAVIVKHANPCGAAVSDAGISEAYRLAFEADPVSAFGGIVALNREVDADLAAELAANPKADVIIAPGYADGVVQMLAAKRKNTRLIEAPAPEEPGLQIRSLGNAFLVQEADRFLAEVSGWKVVTKVAPTAEQMRDLAMAWKVCARTGSNAIVVVKDEMAVGIGAGQQNRLDSARIATTKAGERVVGSSGASDAFFPFPDGMLALAEAGVAAIISPGGSINDSKVIEAADEAGVAMVFTGERHFKH